MKSKPLHEMDPNELRAHVEKWSLNANPKGVSVERVDDGALIGEWQRPENSTGDGLILYLHGGGYVFGSPKTHRPVSAALGRGAGRCVFSLDYRLAPENPVPAAVDDALACYRALLEMGYDGASISLAGDSAGGGLALALTLAVKERGIAMPGSLVLFSPWTDLTVSGESIRSNEKTDAMFQAAHIIGGAKRVLGDCEPSAAFASPLFADHRGFPPTLIFASDNEVLLDDSTRLYERMRAVGVDATLVVENDLTHAWPIFVSWTPEAKAAVRRASSFIETQARMERGA
ncbi:MAG: alpha/beta hydrolase [Marinicaulis sp.]|nr:alpha/beta hydrolase [Marinicaulis sp.]NNE40009.1 alpha/beta hydrolase [Marinicaulis sp.]NNL87703.1 alpha/beta hydrolase [Marinicaulis sp.]